MDGEQICVEIDPARALVPNPALVRYIFGSPGGSQSPTEDDDIVPGTDFP